MSATDPELYLRLVGERTLLTNDDSHGWAQGELGAAASALVAAGVLTLPVAEAVVRDYRLAAGLRGNDHARMALAQPATAPATETPTAPLVARCRPGLSQATAPVDDDWAWDVHVVVFGDPETVLNVSSDSMPPWERGNRGGWIPGRMQAGRPHPGRTGTLALADDTGHVEQAHFNGGGGQGAWSGQYRTSSPLSPTTRWLEFDGRRLDLVRPASLPTVRVEDHGTGSPAERHLRHRLSTGDTRYGDDGDRSDAAIEALVATGALDSDAPVRAELDAVRAARTGGLPLGLGRSGPASKASAAAPAGLPEPWASVLRTARAAGPAGVVPLGVATPVIEGAAAVFRALTSTAEHFAVDTHEVGGDGPPSRGDHVERIPSIAWWAQDDLGQWYRGDWHGWSGDEDGMTGDVLYSPQLDPRARTLRLLPTMPSRRAVVEITLPDWGADVTGPGLLPAGTTVACQDRLHRLAWSDGVLTALDHDDVDGELVLGALGGEPTACAQIVAAWRHAADDLRVLVLASRGPADPVTPGDDRLWPATVPAAAAVTSSSFGWYGYSPLSASTSHGHHRPGHRPGNDEQPDADQLLAGLLTLGGGLPERLVAGVTHTWTDRLVAGTAPAAAMPALTAALHSRVGAAVRQWRHDAGSVAVTMLPPGSVGTLATTEDGVEIALPFCWLTDVWVPGLAVVLGRLVLGVTLDGSRLVLDAVGPGADLQQLVITLPD